MITSSSVSCCNSNSEMSAIGKVIHVDPVSTRNSYSRFSDLPVMLPLA